MSIGMVVLSIVMTLTVETKQSVKSTGTVPEGMQATYSCTYQKGDVRNGDTALLALNGLEGLRIEKVDVYVKSNKTAGAGQITMTADGTQFYRKEGTYKDWFGAYNNVDYQAIGWKGSQALTDGTLAVEVVGTVNSLHLEKYEITYSRPEAQAYSLTIVTDATVEILNETEPESGVVLPKRDDRGEWYFAGWTKSDIEEPTEQKPTLMKAGELYHPKKDETLWAVWTDVESPTWQRQAEPKTGYYVLELGDYMLSGDVENGLIALVESGQVYTSDVYYLDFRTEDSTCTIKNYLSEKYVGYNFDGTELATDESQWHYRVLPDSTWLFIAKEENERFWLLFQKGEVEKAWLSDYVLGDNPRKIWSLYRVGDPAKTQRWWSHPTIEEIEIVHTDDQAYVVRIGVYEIHIKNGKKTIYLRK